MNIVIIGAGQTGRGFVAKIKKENKITFIDKKLELVQTLKKEKQYSVHYFDDEKIEVISNFDVHHVDDTEAVLSIANADIVTTSVFANEIENLIPLLKKGISKREKKNKLIVVCIENGVNVKQVLVDAELNAYISEGLIFCTSIRDENSLDITSESNIELPVDNTSLPYDLDINNFVQIDNFKELIQRKIYTYNYISAIVAYVGYYKGYKEYAKSANDEEVSNIINSKLELLNHLLVKEFNITREEQKEFSLRAIKKFRNHKIVDSIKRNAQQVERKLGNNERILTPIQLAVKFQKDPSIFYDIVAYALFYGAQEEGLNFRKMISEINEVVKIPGFNEKIISLYKRLVDSK